MPARSRLLGKGEIAMKRKWLLIFFIGCLAILMSSAQSAMCASADNNEARETVVKAFEHMEGIKSYHMQINGNGSVKLQGKELTITVLGDCNVQAKPLFLKNVITVSVKADKMQNQQNITQYIVQEGEQMTVYSQMNQTWVKQVIPMPTPQNIEKTDYRKQFSHVSLLTETGDSSVYEVTVDGKYLQEIFSKAMPASDTANIKDLELLFNNMGDIRYNVTVNKKENTVSGMNMDLSTVITGIVNKVVTMPGINMTEDQKAVLNEVLSTLKLDVAIQFSQFNNIAPIVIPEKALKAPLVTMPQTASVNVGYVNTKKVLEEGILAQEYREKLAELSEGLNNRLEEARSNLTEAEFQQRQKEEYQDFFAAKNALKKDMENKMQTAVAAVAREKKLKSVVYRQADKDYIPLGSVDITADVLAYLMVPEGE